MNRSARFGTAASTIGDRIARKAVTSKVMAKVGSFTDGLASSWPTAPPAEKWPPGLSTPPMLQYGYRCAALKYGMITSMVTNDQPSPQAISRKPQPNQPLAAGWPACLVNIHVGACWAILGDVA